MKIIDVLGQPCPIPVIESKKALAEQDTDAVMVKVDNIVAVQNLEKMAHGKQYSFSYQERSPGHYEVVIGKNGDSMPILEENTVATEETPGASRPNRLVVVISKDSMGAGSDELGKILIKGFIYSLTELAPPPESVIFLNSGVFLTAEGANTIADIKKLEAAGTHVLSCGTCVNYFALQDKLAVGQIADMYGIAEKMARADSVVNL